MQASEIPSAERLGVSQCFDVLSSAENALQHCPGPIFNQLPGSTQAQGAREGPGRAGAFLETCSLPFSATLFYSTLGSRRLFCGLCYSLLCYRQHFEDIARAADPSHVSKHHAESPGRKAPTSHYSNTHGGCWKLWPLEKKMGFDSHVGQGFNAALYSLSPTETDRRFQANAQMAMEVATGLDCASNLKV